MGQLKHLKNLVDSLDRSEKRYIRIHLNSFGKKDGQQGQLFDRIQELSEEQLSSETFLQADHLLANNLPTLTRRLLETVLTVTGTLHGGKTYESRLNRSLENIATLYRKKQWDLASWILGKEKQIARQFSHIPQLLSLLDWERKVLLAEFPEGSLDRMKAIRDEEIAAMNLLTLQRQLSHADFMVRHLIRQRLHLVGGQLSPQFAEISRDPIVDAGLRSGDFLSYAFASNIRGIAFNALKQYGEALKVYGKVFQAWRENPAWIREYPVLFLSLFSNYQISLFHGQENPDILEECLLFIRTINLPDPSVRLIFQNISYQTGIMLYLNQGRFESAYDLSAEINDWLQANASQLSANVHLTFHYNAVALYLMIEKFELAQRSIQRILDLPGKEARTDIREMARVLQVLVALELGDKRFADYLQSSTYQIFMRKGMNPFHQLALAHLRSLIRMDPSANPRELHAAFLLKLDEFLQESGGKTPFGLMEVRIWAEARAQGIPLQEVFSKLLQSG